MKKIVSIVLLACLAIVCSPSQKADAQVTYGNYCCDGYGVRRCVLETPAPVNTQCYCFNQGVGLTCL